MPELCFSKWYIITVAVSAYVCLYINRKAVFCVGEVEYGSHGISVVLSAHFKMFYH